jgi:hypothetical protein
MSWLIATNYCQVLNLRGKSGKRLKVIVSGISTSAMLLSSLQAGEAKKIHSTNIISISAKNRI